MYLYCIAYVVPTYLQKILLEKEYVPIHFLTRTGKIIYRRSRREVKVNFENWLTCPEREIQICEE